MMTFPLGALDNMPQIRAMLGIPENHYIGMLIGSAIPKSLCQRHTEDNGRGPHLPAAISGGNMMNAQDCLQLLRDVKDVAFCHGG